MPSPACKADTADLAPSAVESLGTPAEPPEPAPEPGSASSPGAPAKAPSPRTPARKGILGRFLGAFRLAPKGFYPIPGSRHGGYHKQVNGRWVTWYPSDDHARRALRYHNYHAVKHYYDHLDERDKTTRGEHVRAFVDHQNHADGAEAFLRERGKLKAGDLPEHPLRGASVRVTKTNIRATHPTEASPSPQPDAPTPKGKRPGKGPARQSRRATQRADEEQVQLLRSPTAKKERKPRQPRAPQKSKEAPQPRSPRSRKPRKLPVAPAGKSPPRTPIERTARSPGDEQAQQRLERLMDDTAPRRTPRPAPVLKAAPHEGLALRPSRTNPRSRRWERVTERPQDRRGRPVQGHEVKAGAHFALERREGVRVQRTTPEETWLSWGDSRHEWRAPTALVPQLVHDLRGELHGAPTSPDPTLNRALRGEGRFLGKGDQGVAVRVGDEVVKAATIAPYHPENGIRSREQANQNLEREQAAHDLLAQHPLTPACRLVHHQGRTYLVKPYLSPAGRLSGDELEQVQDYVNALHEAGWDHGDEIELGRDPTGQIKMIDLGMARPTRDGEHEGDHMRLDRLFENHGQQRTPSGRELDRWYEKERMLLTGGILGLTNPRTRERSWARYLRAADAKGRALLDADQDDAWERHQDEVRMFADQLEEERAKAGWVNPETAAGAANQA